MTNGYNPYGSYSSGMNWVIGIEGAKAWPMRPNDKVRTVCDVSTKRKLVICFDRDSFIPGKGIHGVQKIQID